MALKTSKGKLDVGNLSAWWRAALDDLAATALPLKPDHIAALAHLPPLHQDPFHRGLMGQAMVEELVLLNTDSVIPHYASERMLGGTVTALLYVIGTVAHIIRALRRNVRPSPFRLTEVESVPQVRR